MAERQPSSRNCFLCGRDNPVGLKAHWENHREAGEIRGSVSVPDHFCGYPGVVHGGIVAALLDETAGRTILMDGGADDLMVTAKLDVVYRRPTPTETPLTLVGRLQARSGDRAKAEAELQLSDGTVVARGAAVLARPPGGMSSAWEAERPYWRVDEE